MKRLWRWLNRGLESEHDPVPAINEVIFEPPALDGDSEMNCDAVVKALENLLAYDAEIRAASTWVSTPRYEKLITEAYDALKEYRHPINLAGSEPKDR